jgi:hypothetical protein
MPTYDDEQEPQARGCAAWSWVTPADLDKHALSSPQAKLAERGLAPRAQRSLWDEM